MVARLDYRVQDGFQPGEGTVVGELKSPRECSIRILVPEEDVDRIHPGTEVETWLPAWPVSRFIAGIEDIRPYSELDLRESPFSSRFGGEIATEEADQLHKDSPIEAYYVCSVRFNNHGMLPLGITGQAAVSFPPESTASRLFRNAMQTFNRESLF